MSASGLMGRTVPLFRVTLRFVDKNQGAIREVKMTHAAACLAAVDLLKKYAGVKYCTIIHPNGFKDVYGADGKFLFGLPLDSEGGVQAEGGAV